MVESAALEMRCTHYVVPGVRIPHSPQRIKTICLSEFTQASKLSLFFEQGTSGSLLGLRSNPSLLQPNLVKYGYINYRTSV